MLLRKAKNLRIKFVSLKAHTFLKSAMVKIVLKYVVGKYTAICIREA